MARTNVPKAGQENPISMEGLSDEHTHTETNDPRDEIERFYEVGGVPEPPVRLQTVVCNECKKRGRFEKPIYAYPQVLKLIERLGIASMMTTVVIVQNMDIGGIILDGAAALRSVVNQIASSIPGPGFSEGMGIGVNGTAGGIPDGRSWWW
ncbi:hypothetical protein TWF281_006590 [Arthrobotrys megalospora]